MVANCIIRNRWTTYAVGIGVVAVTLYLGWIGEMNWALNWFVLGAMEWSDIGFLELNGSALLLNRLMVLVLAVFLFSVAVQWFPRRDPDSAGPFGRMGSRPLLLATLRTLPLAVPAVALGMVLWFQIQGGFQGDAAREAEKNYWRTNVAEWTDVKVPALVRMDVDLELDPINHSFRSQGRYRLVNHLDHPVAEIPFTQDLMWDSLSWFFDDAEHDVENRAGLWILRPGSPLEPGDSLWVGFRIRGRMPMGITANGGSTGEFILPSSVFIQSFAPIPGFLEHLGMDEEYARDLPEAPPDLYLQELDPLGGSVVPMSTRIRITGPDYLTYNSVGRRVEEKREQGRVTVVWESNYPVRIFNVAAGRWDVWRGEGIEIYYHPEHSYNLEEMGLVLGAARRWYSEWFAPCPWGTLKLSETLGSGASPQGYPTNITVSELVFLTKADPQFPTVFWVTAHETAHQWWGNLLAPGDGPGGAVISEGMANFSTLLLAEQVRGDVARRGISKRLEEQYLRGRWLDHERPLVATDGSHGGDGAVIYGKGAWVPWMLMGVMGREPMLEGLREFIARYRDGPDWRPSTG